MLRLCIFLCILDKKIHFDAYHRKKHTKSALSASLTDIKGIGPAKAKSLIIKFGTLQRIGEATKAELMSVKGITEANAIEIIKTFKGE